jgi:EAL and modified HD-GYP domain-containing signal transduction protein
MERPETIIWAPKDLQRLLSYRTTPMFQFLRKLFGKKAPPGKKKTVRGEPRGNGPPKSESQRATANHTFVCRDSILNRDQRIAGYEFSLHKRLHERLSGKSLVVRRAYDEVLLRHLDSTNAGSILSNRMVVVGIAPASLDNAQLQTLSATNTLLMLDPTDDSGAEFVGLRDRVEALTQMGFRIGYRLRPEMPLEVIPPIFDFIQISTPAYDGIELAGSVSRLRKLKKVDAKDISLIAADIESPDDFHVCWRAKFDYFHGPFVNLRQIIEPPRGNVDRSFIMNVLGQLRSGADIAELAKTIGRDAMVTFKLLRYINSAANGLTQEITSIEQCLLLLGRERIYRWLSLLLFDLHNAGYSERILTEQALVRASLMERIGIQARAAGVNADHLFLTGLFSVLDKLLNRPLREILASVSMPQTVTDALIGDSGPIAPFLALAIACESGDPEKIAKSALACRVDETSINEEMLQALAWANTVAEIAE